MDNSLYRPPVMPMGTADHVMDVESELMEADIAARMYNPKLSALRAQHTGLPIVPMTNKALAIVLPAGTVVDVNLPSGTKMVRFNSDAFFVVSRNGRAQVPPVATANGDMDASIGSFFPATDTYYYVEEIQQLSMVSDLQARVSIECFSQL